MDARRAAAKQGPSSWPSPSRRLQTVCAHITSRASDTHTNWRLARRASSRPGVSRGSLGGSGATALERWPRHDCQSWSQGQTVCRPAPITRLLHLFTTATMPVTRARPLPKHSNELIIIVIILLLLSVRSLACLPQSSAHLLAHWLTSK